MTFVCYWHLWLLQNPNYKLGNNFITLNACLYIELNAHALNTFLLTLRDSNNAEEFLPWMLGSQTCERVFRAARHMSSTFSTVINFEMLGQPAVHRLHKLHTQFCLEAESGEAVIKYPCVEAHKFKDGNTHVHVAIINSITHSLLMKTFHGYRRVKEVQKVDEALGTGK